MRRSTMRWTAAAVTVAVLLWTADATVRVLLSSDGTFLGQLLTPSAGTLVFRATLVSLGIIAVLSLRGMRQLEVARHEAVEERRRLRELSDYTTDAVVMLDRELRIVFMNKAAERIGGTRLADSIGWPCYRCILNEEQPCRGCRALEVFETGEWRSATKYEVTASGQENWLEQRWYPVRDAHGAVEGVLEVAHDITDRKLMEREVAACHQALDAVRRERESGGPAAGRE